MSSTSKAHRVYPQPCCYSWPPISSSAMGTEAALELLGIYQAACAGGRDPCVLWHSPSQAASPDAAQAAFFGCAV